MERFFREFEDGAGMAQRLRHQEEARRDVADYLLTFYNQNA